MQFLIARKTWRDTPPEYAFDQNGLKKGVEKIMKDLSKSADFPRVFPKVD
jgi:hypothetical protein